MIATLIYHHIIIILRFFCSFGSEVPFLKLTKVLKIGIGNIGRTGDKNAVLFEMETEHDTASSKYK